MVGKSRCGWKNHEWMNQLINEKMIESIMQSINQSINRDIHWFNYLHHIGGHFDLDKSWWHVFSLKKIITHNKPHIHHPCHDDVIKWKHFPCYWPFVPGIHRSPVNSPHKGQWRGALVFSLICSRINCWVNHREAGDLRRHRAHYDVIVMFVSTISRCDRVSRRTLRGVGHLRLKS